MDIASRDAAFPGSPTLKSINLIRIRADPKRVFRAAADVLEWPRLLSHYRRGDVVEGLISDASTAACAC